MTIEVDIKTIMIMVILSKHEIFFSPNFHSQALKLLKQKYCDLINIYLWKIWPLPLNIRLELSNVKLIS